MSEPVGPIVLLVLALVQAPSDWDDTSEKAWRLILQGKPAEAVTLFETVIRASPNFADRHLELAQAHLAVAETLKERGASQAAVQRRHLQTAATHYRRAIDLGSSRAIVAMKDLVDV